MRTVLVLMLFVGGTAFSFPYWKSNFPQLQQFLDSLLNKPQQPVVETSFVSEAVPLEKPAVPKKKMVYQWKDDQGQLQFTESPPPDDREFKEMVLKSKQPTELSHQEKDQRVADYKKAAKSYRKSAHYVEKPKSSGRSRSSKNKCSSIDKKIRKKEDQLSNRGYRGRAYDKKNSELRDLKYKKLKGC